LGIKGRKESSRANSAKKKGKGARGCRLVSLGGAGKSESLTGEREKVKGSASRNDM